MICRHATTFASPSCAFFLISKGGHALGVGFRSPEFAGRYPLVILGKRIMDESRLSELIFFQCPREFQSASRLMSYHFKTPSLRVQLWNGLSSNAGDPSAIDDGVTSLRPESGPDRYSTTGFKRDCRISGSCSGISMEVPSARPYGFVTCVYIISRVRKISCRSLRCIRYLSAQANRWYREPNIVLGSGSVYGGVDSRSKHTRSAERAVVDLKDSQRAATIHDQYSIGWG